MAEECMAATNPDPLPQAQNARYRVFLSYSHADRRWARRVLRWLENWTVPQRLVGAPTAYGPAPRRLGPVFRDREELGAAPELSETIGNALADSASMLVVCSPAAARSRWVNEEILTFKRLGRADRIVALIVAGDPTAGDGSEQCFPPALRFRLRDDGRLGDEPMEPIAADARDIGDGPRRARRKVQAALLGVNYDTLAQREQQRRNRRLVAVTALSLLGMAGTLALSVTAWRAQQDADRRRAQAENLVDFMLGDLRERAGQIGRLDLLETVGDEVVAYFAQLGPRDLDDRALAQQSKALTQLGEVQLALGNSDRALTAFDEAWRRSAELAARHRADQRLLFDRGQAEFWVGFVHLERGDRAAAWDWLSQYRDTAMQLHVLDPDNPEVQLELVYGESNLGALAFGEGRLAEAETAYDQASENLRALIAQAPDRDDLRFELADSLSWTGSIHERQGRVSDARHRFRETAAMLAELHRAHPSNRIYEARLVSELIHFARVSLLAGDFAAALAHYDEALGHSDDLLRHDPRNQAWRRSHAIAHLGKVDALLRLGLPGEADVHVAIGLEEARLLAEADANNADWMQLYAHAQSLRAAIALELGDPASAAELVTAALDTMEGAPAGRDIVADASRTAELQLIAGDVAQATQGTGAAAAHWLAGLAALDGAPGGAPGPAGLLLRSELLSRLERCEETRHARAQLAALGAWSPVEACPRAR
jgi:eukaryotic-like serine/threonine-protein kinase